MIQMFNNLPWHDAELKEIIINRERNDEIKLLVGFPTNDGISAVCIEFFDCYALKPDMHFGILSTLQIFELIFGESLSPAR